MNITRSQEDYLKIIWHLQEEQKKATAKAVADNLQVKSPTALSMFRLLVKCGQISYNKTDGARLTESGENTARKLVRKHRLIETFLETIFDMDGQNVHDEAEKLEHVISDQLMHRIDAYLGFPEKDPHGSEIPAWDKAMQRINLSTVQLNDSFSINELNLQNDEKKYYQKSDLTVTSVWTMIEIPPGSECYLIGNGKRFLAIPDRVAENILVTLRK
ncbi:MAG: metal-dependent transcriptional regulator [Calditrichaeota bacterium]|nr:metal-dependent transcriptional regulator [Calditrichota bacterium]